MAEYGDKKVIKGPFYIFQYGEDSVFYFTDPYNSDGKTTLINKVTETVLDTDIPFEKFQEAYIELQFVNEISLLRDDSGRYSIEDAA